MDVRRHGRILSLEITCKLGAIISSSIRNFVCHAQATFADFTIAISRSRHIRSRGQRPSNQASRRISTNRSSRTCSADLGRFAELRFPSPGLGETILRVADRCVEFPCVRSGPVAPIRHFLPDPHDTCSRLKPSQPLRLTPMLILYAEKGYA